MLLPALLFPGVFIFAQTPPAPLTVSASSALAPAAPLPLLGSPSAAPQFAPADGEDIADIRGVWVPDYQTYLRRALIVSAAALIVSGLAWWLWRRWRARRPTLTLYQRALQRLQQCRALIADGNARAFCGEVSDIARDWLERRFKVPSTHQTTEEFFQTAAARAGDELEPHLPALKNFLVYCDMAKFARGELTVEQMNLMWDSAERFVETTRPADNAAENSPSVKGGPRSGRGSSAFNENQPETLKHPALAGTPLREGNLTAADHDQAGDAS
jgi:hypothetical protein